MRKIEDKILKILEMLINRILKKRNKRLYKGGQYYIQQGVVKYECCYCKRSQVALPEFKNQKYSYIVDDGFPHIEIQDESKDELIELYGWCIERRAKNWHKWGNAKPHKIYRSEEIAIDSMNQLKSNPDQFAKLFNYEYRIRPLYSLTSAKFRELTINKILDIK